MKLKLVAACCVVLLSLIGGDTFLRGRVISVADGDTLTVYVSPARKEKIRLYGIDCPESEQAGGREATEFTRSKALFKQVELSVFYKDTYGRSVALVTLPDKSVLNEQLVGQGHAWVYSRFCTAAQCGRWKRLEAEARSVGRGLWRSGKAQAPWKWRRNNGR